MMSHARAINMLVYSVAVLSTICANGCARTERYLIVESRFQEDTAAKKQEITKAKRYTEVLPTVKSVAVRAPTSCAGESASQVTGEAMANKDIIKTKCGVEMSEIERALIRQGFTVYSWSLVNNMMTSNRTDTSGVGAARELGAQVLFQVNSLERVGITPSRDVTVERSYFESNNEGARLKPADLDEDRTREVKNYIGDIELQRLANAKKFGAMLDVNAIDTATGQTIWFYRWAKHEEGSKIVFSKFHLHCWDRWGCLSAEDEKNTPQQQKASTPGPKSKEVESISTAARPANVQDSIYFDLLRDITADFSKQFASGL